MELDELKQTWNEHARKLDRMLRLNLQSLKAAKMEKTQSALARFKAMRVFEMLTGIAVLIPLGLYISHRLAVLTLSIPALIFAASVLIPVIGSIRQLVLLGQIDYAEPVTAIQRKLEEIKLNYLRSIRWPVLMLPLYLVYVALGFNLLFGVDILAHGDRTFFWVNLIVSLIFLAPAIWVFRNLSFSNIGNPVIRVLVHGAGGKQMIAAMEFLKALREFETEDPSMTA
jgi:hypothetical protein